MEIDDVDYSEDPYEGIPIWVSFPPQLSESVSPVTTGIIVVGVSPSFTNYAGLSPFYQNIGS